MKDSIYHTLQTSTSKKIALLIDPDKHTTTSVEKLVQQAQKAGVDFIFVGGSLLLSNHLDLIVQTIKSHFTRSVLLFPGNAMQISSEADGILFLSLISGRNPEFLIGNHVIAAPMLKQTSLEILSTGYLLIDGGKTTTAHYMSGSMPIPRDKPEIATCTALAGEMLGMKLIYMDAGSGAQFPVAPEMIAMVKKNITIPLIVGGGIRSKEQAIKAIQAGADVIVVGNIIEENPQLLEEITHTVHAVMS